MATNDDTAKDFTFLDMDGLNEDEKIHLKDILLTKESITMMNSIPITFSDYNGSCYNNMSTVQVNQDDFNISPESNTSDEFIDQQNSDSAINLDDSIVSSQAFPDLQEPIPIPFYGNTYPQFPHIYTDGLESWQQQQNLLYATAYYQTLSSGQQPYFIHHSNPYNLHYQQMPFAYDPLRPPPNFMEHVFLSQQNFHRQPDVDINSYKSTSDTGNSLLSENGKCNFYNIQQYNSSEKFIIGKNRYSKSYIKKNSKNVSNFNVHDTPENEPHASKNVKEHIFSSNLVDSVDKLSISYNSNKDELDINFGDLDPELRKLVKENNNNNAVDGATHSKFNLITDLDSAHTFSCISDIPDDNNNSDSDQQFSPSETGLPQIVDHNDIAFNELISCDGDAPRFKPKDISNKHENIPKKSSWAALFKNEPNFQHPVIVQGTSIDGFNPLLESSTDKYDLNKEQKCRLASVGKFLNSYSISYESYAIRMRGLINKNNWCYINATLQSLISCSPFVRLLRDLPSTGQIHSVSPMPITDAFVNFVNEFERFSIYGSQNDKAKLRFMKTNLHDLNLGLKFEPSSIYKVIHDCENQKNFKAGRQEDAEEFLTFVLNSLHEEFLMARKSVSNLHNGNSANFADIDNEDDNNDLNKQDFLDSNWEQVGPKNKSVITRHAMVDKTAIMDLFGGLFRSAVHKMGEKDSATLEPFFTLQLDIQSDNVNSVREALDSFASKEILTDITSLKTNQHVDATRRITLEHLPPILILHLKAFVYDKNGGCLKVSKNIDFDCNMEINKELLSPNVRSKYSLPSSRRYTLFAVVGHHGEKAHGGHYSADIYHKGLNCWLKADDGAIRRQTKANVFKQNVESLRIPYLLYYERTERLS